MAELFEDPLPVTLDADSSGETSVLFEQPLPVFFPDGLPGASDDDVAGYVRDPESQTRSALNDNYEIKNRGGDLAAVSTATISGPTNITAAMFPSTCRWTLGGNASVGTLESPASGVSGTITFRIIQAASGGPYTFTWPTTIEWPGDAPAPTVPTVANAYLLVHLFWDGTIWNGLVGGVFYP